LQQHQPDLPYAACNSNYNSSGIQPSSVSGHPDFSFQFPEDDAPAFTDIQLDLKDIVSTPEHCQLAGAILGRLNKELLGYQITVKAECLTQPDLKKSYAISPELVQLQERAPGDLDSTHPSVILENILKEYEQSSKDIPLALMGLANQPVPLSGMPSNSLVPMVLGSTGQ
jgi:hypothetical protein